MNPTGQVRQGDVNLGPGLIGSLVATTTTCIVSVALRFWVRGRLVKAIGWDDWTILLALVCSPPSSLILLKKLYLTETF